MTPGDRNRLVRTRIAGPLIWARERGQGQAGGGAVSGVNTVEERSEAHSHRGGAESIVQRGIAYAFRTALEPAPTAVTTNCLLSEVA